MKPSFDGLIDAITFAAPFAIASRYDAPNECVRASVAGAAALRTFGLEARPVGCAVMGWRFDGARGFSCGLTEQEAKAASGHEGGVQGDMPLDGAFHVVIETTVKKRRALVDLTFGQLAVHGVRSPFAIARKDEEGWPVFEDDDWHMQYLPCERTAEALDLCAQYARDPACPFFRDDIIGLMQQFMQMGRDRDAFVDALLMQHPQAFAHVEKLAAWMNGSVGLRSAGLT